MNRFYSIRIKKHILFYILFYLSSCQINTPTQLFEPLASSVTGIDFKNQLVDTPDQNIIEYLYYYNGGGVSIGDVNNDQLLDIYFTSNQGINRLFINNGDLKFTDATKSYNLPIKRDPNKWSTGVSMVDINGDGYLDIYECVVGDYKSFKGHNKLYINKSGNSFEEYSKQFGLDFVGFSTQAGFFDYDQDGDLDLYLLNHSVHGTDTYGSTKLRLKEDKKAGDRLFENRISEGHGFVDVTLAANIYSSQIGYGLGLGISDLNNDGYLDIYIANDFHEDDYLYINNGDKTFMESSEKLFGQTSQFSMGLDIADLDGDNKMDIFTLDMLAYDPKILLRSAGGDNNFIRNIKAKNGYRSQYSHNTMQINYGNHFKELSKYYGIYATDWSWSVLIQDYDNDLDQDIFITNGIYKRPNDLDYIEYLSNEILQNDHSTEELVKRMPSDKISNVFFENNNFNSFKRNTTNTGLRNDSFSNGMSYGDLDNDGDLDLVVNNLNAESIVYENTPDDKNNFLNVSLYENSNNSYSIGAKVSLFIGSLTLTKELVLTRGFLSSIPPRLHFGLGKYSMVDSMSIQWPDQAIQWQYGIASNQFLQISKKDKNRKLGINEPLDNQMPTEKHIAFKHHEDKFEDYQIERLLPWSLSKEGPAVSITDLNNDGINDFYIGGAHFQSGELFISSVEGRFIKTDQFDFRRDAGYEDVASIFFDFNDDGFEDLFICSGGGRFPEEHPLLEDRLYLNDGNNKFNRYLVKLPMINTSSVSIKKDNQTNLLFVGAKSIPGQYGLVPNSYLLILKKNQVENLIFHPIGFVNDSEWVDLDNDGTTELMVVGDWMPIKLFDYTIEGGLIPKKNKLFQKTNGFWKSITVGDLNNDGRKDYFFANIGNNNKWKPTFETPTVMYCHDFDGNGQVDPIIFYYYNDQFIPFATRLELIKQIPAIKKTHPTNTSFENIRRLQDLVDIENYESFEVYQSKSLLMLSSEYGYSWEKLPAEFQYGTIQDAFISNKGFIYYVGNDFNFYSSLGKSYGNHGGIGEYDNRGIRWNILPLSHKFEYRHIEPLDTNSLLIAPNSQSPLRLKMTNN